MLATTDQFRSRVGRLDTAFSRFATEAGAAFARLYRNRQRFLRPLAKAPRWLHKGLVRMSRAISIRSRYAK